MVYRTLARLSAHRDWGSLYRMTGQVQYSISPYEQKIFKGMIKEGFPNMVRRFNEQWWRILPAAVLAYLVYDYASREAIRMSKKDPKQYENDT